MVSCSTCNISVKKRYLANHIKSNLHKNNSFQIHHDLPNVTLLETAFGKRIFTYRITSTVDTKDLSTVESFVSSINDDLTKLIIDSRLRLKTFKVNFILFANFVQPSKNLFNVFDFQTSNFIISESDDISIFINSLKETLEHRVIEFEKKDSGWSLKDIISLDMNINKFNPLKGSSFIELPHDIRLKKAVINIKNADVQCLKWALLSALYPAANHLDLISSYSKNENKLKFDGISFPVKITDISKVERLNNISVNVFGLEYDIKSKCHKVIGPLHFSKSRKPKHINLLYITNGNNGHYCYIKNLSRLVSKQITQRNGAIHICDGCLLYFPNTNALITHQKNDCVHIRTELPSPNVFKKNWSGENISNNKIYFDKFNKKKRVPFVIYADFESFLKPIASCSPDPNLSSTTNVQRHDVFSFGYYIKCSYDDNLSKYVSYSGKNSAHIFLMKLQKDLKIICEKNRKQIRPLPLTPEDKKCIDDATVCHICEKKLNTEKFIDHDWYTGSFIGVAHENCSNKFHKIDFVPVILHNLSNYDAHFIVHALNFAEGEVQIIPQNKEKYISFSKILIINGHKINLRFIDSFKFVSSSLDSLASNLNNDKFNELRSQYPDERDFNLLKRKGVFPYEYLTCFESLKSTSLPQIEDFYSSLTDSTISFDDYTHAQRVWSHFQCNNMFDYSNLYLKTDVLLLSDVFENFRNVCLKTYGLDPVHYYTAPGLSWDAMLKFTQVELELLTDFEKIAFVKSGIRGGVSQCSNRYAKANNLYMDDFKPDEPSSYLTYLDANNLYGWAMSQYLPISQFEWETNDINFNVPIDSNIGYILEVDLEYPQHLHDAHSDFPLCPENICVGGSKEPKLVPNLYDKKKYIIHYRNLIQCLELGLKLTKVHRVLKFQQSSWLKKYIDLNTHLRTLANSDFEKDFYKLMNNSIFGKTMENIEKRVNVKLLTDWEDCGKRKGVQSLIAKPEFHSLSIFSENLVAVQLQKTKLLYNKPIYLGFCILDISKTLMYDFHYKYMKCKFPNLKLMYTDTDSLVYQVFCTDFYKELKPDLSDHFDTSDYDKNNIYGFPLVNKKKLGFFKDEHNGNIFTEFVGLRSKMYAMRVNNKTMTKAKGVNKCVTKRLALDNYKSCLFDNNIQLAEMYRFRSIKHVIFTQKINKISLSYNDTKRYIIPKCTNTLAWGHYSLK